jgi:hypothetical protein
VADRSGAPEGGQARRPALPGAPRGAFAVGAAALAGWALLAVGGGGIDPGDGLGGPGPRAAFLALALGAPLAALALVMAWNRAALRSLPARLALAGAGGLALWSAASMLWAAAPDLAWIDANRQAIALCALVVGLCAGALLPGAPGLLGLGLSAAAMLPMGLALATKALPAALGHDSDLARLAAPVGYWNGLALVAVIAVPGLLWLAGGATGIRGAVPIAAVGLTVVLTTLLLTYSRGGILALAMAVVVTTAFLPRRAPALAALAAGAICAALPTAYALTDPVLSADQIPTALREDAAAGLAWRILVALAVAAVLAPGLARLAGRLALDRRRARRLAAVLAVGVIVVGAVGTLASEPARDWGGDRLAEFRGEGGDAVANDPGRLVNAAGNQRKGWWGEAWRGFTEQPAIGRGAGGFSLIHLQERRSGDDDLNTREAHGVLPSVVSGTGLVGFGLLVVLVAGVVWGVVRAGVRHPGADIGVPFGILAAFTLQASVDWSWQIPALTVPAFAAAGVVLAAAAPGGRDGRPGRPGPVAAGLIAGACLLAVASAALPWWSSHQTSTGEDALAGGRPAVARDRADDARAANPLTIAPLLLLGRAHTDLGEPARALGAYREATRLQPDNPEAWRALAIFLGRDPSAVDAWREVRRLDPQDPEAALRAG